MARKHHYAAFASNLLAVACLGVLLGLGIYVNLKTFVVEGFYTTGYNVLSVNQSVWNVGCTIVGTAVGLLTALGLTCHDDFLTRKAIVSEKGVVALYIRPLTTWRALVQVARGQLNAIRLFLALLLLASALSSAATVAIFGIHNIDVEIINPIASFPLSFYNITTTFFYTTPDGAYFPAMTTFNQPLLEGFLFKSAYIGAATAFNPSRFVPYAGESGNWIPSSGQLGDTIYSSLSTGGIGLNMTSYLDYAGHPGSFNLPSHYAFNQLTGNVFGTHVDVTCVNATANYNISHSNYDESLLVFTITNNNGVNFALIQDEDTLRMGGYLPGQKNNSLPVLTLAIPSYWDKTAYVCECTWSGREYLASVNTTSRDSPLSVVAEVEQGPYIGHDVQWSLAGQAAQMIIKPWGGSLISAWTSAEYGNDGANNTDTATLLSAILSQVGEAQISLMRQTVEMSNLDTSMYKPFGSNATMYVTIPKMGGGEWGWLSVFGLLLLSALLGVVRTLWGYEMVDWEVQDPLRILESTLNDGKIGETAILKFDGKIRVLPVGHKGQAA